MLQVVDYQISAVHELSEAGSSILVNELALVERVEDRSAPDMLPELLISVFG